MIFASMFVKRKWAIDNLHVSGREIKAEKLWLKDACNM
jgi:hypothetical protein